MGAHRLFRALRWAEATTDLHGLSDEKIEALSAEVARLYGLLVQAPITSRSDAIAKLEAAADFGERGLRLDGSDESMLRQVINWLRQGGLH